MLAVGFAGQSQAAAGHFLFQEGQRQWLLANAVEHHAFATGLDVPLRLMAAGAQGQLLEVGIFAGAGGRVQAVQAAHLELAVAVGLLAAGEAPAHIGEQFVTGVVCQVGGFLQNAGAGHILDHEATGFIAGLEQQLAAPGAQFALHAHSADVRIAWWGGQHLAAGEQGQQGGE
ncbi:hypothetical protein D3C79_838020 [compost metagenome]